MHAAAHPLNTLGTGELGRRLGMRFSEQRHVSVAATRPAVRRRGSEIELWRLAAANSAASVTEERVTRH